MFPFNNPYEISFSSNFFYWKGGRFESVEGLLDAIEKDHFSYVNEWFWYEYFEDCQDFDESPCCLSLLSSTIVMEKVLEPEEYTKQKLCEIIIQMVKLA